MDAGIGKRKGHPLFSDKWPNAKVAKIAALISKGYSCTAVAAELGDGTTQNQVASMVIHWGIKQPSSDARHTYCDVAVPLAAKYRTQLAQEARRRGLEMPELMAQVMVTMCRDGLYSAILDG